MGPDNTNNGFTYPSVGVPASNTATSNGIQYSTSDTQDIPVDTDVVTTNDAKAVASEEPTHQMNSDVFSSLVGDFGMNNEVFTNSTTPAGDDPQNADDGNSDGQNDDQQVERPEVYQPVLQKPEPEFTVQKPADLEQQLAGMNNIDDKDPQAEANSPDIPPVVGNVGVDHNATQDEVLDLSNVSEDQPTQDDQLTTDENNEDRSAEEEKLSPLQRLAKKLSGLGNGLVEEDSNLSDANDVADLPKEDERSTETEATMGSADEGNEVVLGDSVVDDLIENTNTEGSMQETDDLNTDETTLGDTGESLTFDSSAQSEGSDGSDAGLVDLAADSTNINDTHDMSGLTPQGQPLNIEFDPERLNLEDSRMDLPPSDLNDPSDSPSISTISMDVGLNGVPETSNIPLQDIQNVEVPVQEVGTAPVVEPVFEMGSNNIDQENTMNNFAVPSSDMSSNGISNDEEFVTMQPDGFKTTEETVEQQNEELLGPSVEELADETKPVRSTARYPYTIHQLLDYVVERDASDLHLTVGYPALVRIDGELVPVTEEIITPQHAIDLILPILPEQKKELLEVNREVDLAHAHKEDARFRINAFYQQQSLSAAMRLIPNRIKSIDELQLPQIYHQISKLRQGLVLVTGPTGSGKSTTLAAILQEINANRPEHIITIEDPVEYILPKGRAMVDQRELHEDTHSWEIALKSAMRQDPDVILVGEMRDFETIAAAITLAETGHLVFATLHTNSAAQTIDRIIDVFPEHQQSQVRSQLSNTIESVIAQRLMPITRGGRRAVSEIMLATPAIRNLIREAKTHQIDNVIRTSADIGMISLEHSLVKLVRENVVTLEKAKEYAVHPDEVVRLLKS